MSQLHTKDWFNNAVEIVRHEVGFHDKPYDCLRGRAIGYQTLIPFERDYEIEAAGGDPEPESIEMSNAIAVLRIVMRRLYYDLLGYLGESKWENMDDTFKSVLLADAHTKGFDEAVREYAK